MNTEAVAVLILAAGFSLVEVKRKDAKSNQAVLFARLRNAIVIDVLPQPQGVKDVVLAADPAITVATVFWFVLFGQGNKTVALPRRWLWCEVTEQFRAIINRAIAVSVEHQYCVI